MIYLNTRTIESKFKMNAAFLILSLFTLLIGFQGFSQYVYKRNNNHYDGACNIPHNKKNLGTLYNFPSSGTLVVKPGENIILCGKLHRKSRAGNVEIKRQDGTSWIEWNYPATGDFRFDEEIQIPWCDTTGIIYTIIIYTKVGFGKSKTTTYNLRVAAPTSSTSPPVPESDFTCEKGIRNFSIPNPKNASKLYVYSLGNLPSDMADQEVTDTTKVPEFKVLPSPTGNFDFDLNIQQSGLFMMGYEYKGNPGCFPNTSRITSLSHLVVVYLDLDLNQLPPTMYDTTFLKQCENAGQCNIVGVNYTPLQMTNPVIESRKNALLNEFNSCGYLSNVNLNFRNVWLDSTHTTRVPSGNGDFENRVCFENLNKTALDGNYKYNRKYTLRINAEFSANVKFSNYEDSLYPALAYCQADAMSRVIAQQVPTPEPTIRTVCEPNEKVCLPCKDGMVGLEFWTSKVGGQLLQSPPAVTTAPDYEYFHCNADQKLNSLPDYFDRFCYNKTLTSGAGSHNIVWMNYVSQDGRKSKRVPLAILVMPTIYPIGSNKELLKPTVSDPCASGCSVVFDTSATFHRQAIINSVNAINSNLSAYLNLSVSFDSKWSDEQNYHSTEVPRVCYDDLPSKGGSCRPYYQNLAIYLDGKIFNTCDTSIHEVYQDSCFKTTQVVNVCKAMYPPAPRAIQICGQNSLEEVCFTEIEEYDNYEWVAYKSNGDTVVMNQFTSNCVLPIQPNLPWTSYAQGISGNPYYVRFDVRSVSNENGTTKKSGPSPIVFVILPTPSSSNGILQQSLNKPVIANDTSFSDYCNTSVPEVGTYHDLNYTNPLYTDSIETIIKQVELAIPGMRIDKNITVDWEDKNYMFPGINRVCYGHLRTGLPDTDDKGRLYTGTLNANLNYCINLFAFDAVANMDSKVLSSPHVYPRQADSTLCHEGSCLFPVGGTYVYKKSGVNIQEEPTSKASIQDTSTKGNRISKEEILDFSIVPNPTSNITRIQSNSKSDKQKLSIKNHLGVSLYEIDLNNTGQAILDLSFLTQGSYFVTLISTDNQSKTKLVVKD